MTKDLKLAIDERIRKLQLLRELADDPETLGMIRQLLLGTNGTDAPVTAKQFALRPPSSGRKRGELLRTVEKTLNSCTEAVTTADVVAKMAEQGFVFQSQNWRVSVNEALKTLEGAGKAKIERTEGITNYWRAKIAS